MNVQIGSVEIDNDIRRAINDYFGRPGLATRDTVRGLYRTLANADIEVIAHDYLERKKAEREKRAGR